MTDSARRVNATAAPPKGPHADGRTGSADRSVLRAALIAAACCAVAATLGAWRWGEGPLTFSGVVMHWDAFWYERIARGGYAYTPGQQSPVAFFPLFPLVLRGLGALGVPLAVAGFAVSVVCGVAAIALFNRWARTLAPEGAARDAGTLLALYPFALYLYGVMYSDALFLLLIVGAFLQLERGRLWPAILLGALATAARPVAPALVLGMLARRLEWKRQRHERWTLADLAPVLAAAGFVVYVLYLWARFDAPFAFVETQASPGWDQRPGWQTWLKLTWFEIMFPRVAPAVAVRLGGHALLTLLALAGVWPTVKKLGWGYGLFVLAIVGMPALSSKDFMGMGRYVLAGFPLFLTLALLVRERPRLRTTVQVVSACTLIGVAVAYGAGAYVA